jgi:hypothetical protein
MCISSTITSIGFHAIVVAAWPPSTIPPDGVAATTRSSVCDSSEMSGLLTNDGVL